MINDTNRGSGAKHESSPPRVPSYWTRDRLSKVGRTLERRAADLRADIVRELRKYDDERLTAIADNVADSAELSIADVIGDVYLAEVDRDVRDLHEVERAIARVRAGTYGACMDCGHSVDPQRLRFHPQAARCLHCQENAERPVRDARRSSSL
jgi:DnaK suppressor protein